MGKEGFYIHTHTQVSVVIAAVLLITLQRSTHSPTLQLNSSTINFTHTRPASFWWHSPVGLLTALVSSHKLADDAPVAAAAAAAASQVQHLNLRLELELEQRHPPASSPQPPASDCQPTNLLLTFCPTNFVNE